MKTRYFVSDSYTCDKIRGSELVLIDDRYRIKDSHFFCDVGSGYESCYITKVEEMELSDFIADGRTKYELNGIRFVVETVDFEIGYIGIRTDYAIGGGSDLCAIHSKYSNIGKGLSSHIEDIKLVTTCGQCGKDEVQYNGLCSDCISKLPKIESNKVVDIHKNENGSFSVGSVVNVCEHDEIAYTSSQYVEAIEKEVPDAVNHPSHYTGAGIECIEAIKASMTPDALAGYLKGNVQKYLWRYEKKVNPIEDLKKARWYLDYLINELEQTNV